MRERVASRLVVAVPFLTCNIHRLTQFYLPLATRTHVWTRNRMHTAKAKPWDFDVWMALIQPLEKGGEGAYDDLREAYKEFLTHFPLCYGYWDKLARLEREMQGGSFAAASAVFEQGLGEVKCWELFLKYCTCAVQQVRRAS